MAGVLLLTEDPRVHEDLLRLTATAGTSLDLLADPGQARRAWDEACLVVVAQDTLPALLAGPLPRRQGVVVLGHDRDDPGVWQQALAVGAEAVVFLPEAQAWLQDRVADAGETRGRAAPVLAVVGGRGGAGATTLASALSLAAVRRGLDVVLVDADPLGGGIDLVLGGEGRPGLRWPDLCGSRGRIPSTALAQALPRLHGVAVLSWDRAEPVALPAEAARAVLASARRGHDLVVVDLPRSFDVATRELLAQTTTVLLLVPAELRAAAAAARVASRVGLVCKDIRLVVRGPSPSGMTVEDLRQAVSVPLAGRMRSQRRLARALEAGVPPGRRRGTPLAALCDRLLAELGPAA